MNADRAAELLQIPERGLDLLQRFEEDEKVQKAIQAVQSGFAPADVAAMYGLEYDEEATQAEVSEGDIHVYECQTSKCRQKGRVATCSLGPEDEGVENLTACPECHRPMVYVMGVEDETDINLRRTRTPKSHLHDSMHGVDKATYTGKDFADDE